MSRKITLVLCFLLSFFTQAGAQNITNVIGPLSVCSNTPVRYRAVFSNACLNPNVVDIRKYNQSEGGGNLISHSFVGSGNLPTGEFYQDFDLVFNINFSSWPNGDAIGIVFQSTCNADPNTGQLKAVTISIVPPPSVEITSTDGNNQIITRKILGNIYSGSKTLNGLVSTATANTTYKWTVTGSSFSIAGADDQSQVTISSNTTVPVTGTVTLQAGTSGCGLTGATYAITARSGVARLANTAETSAAAKLPSKDAVALVIYGNPVASNLVAKIINNGAEDQTKKDVLIYDANKRLVKMYRGYTSSATIDLNVSGLSNGVYFLNIVSPKSALSLTKKFVIQR